jgi:hypothetical protein
MKTPTNIATVANTATPAMSRALAGAAFCGRSPWYGAENTAIDPVTKPVTVFADHELRARRLEASSQ